MTRVLAALVFVRLPPGPSEERADAYLTASLRWLIVSVVCQGFVVTVRIIQAVAA